MLTRLNFLLPAVSRRNVPPVLHLLYALLFLSVLPSVVHAAGVVTTPTEAALAAAMQGGGLVTFACDGVIPITITKKVGPGVGGDGTSAMTLDATGHNITLDGGGSAQILNVITSGNLGGSPPPYSLAIKHLTLANGSASKGGGAIYADIDTTLTLSDCVFLNNQATASGGGAICVQQNSIVTITNTRFFNNTASSSGGALLVNSLGGGYNTVNVTNSIFSGNAINAPATSQLAGRGKVLGGAASVSCIDYGSNGVNLCAFTNCAFLNNQITAGANTDVGGGALIVSTSNATIVNCTFAGNRAVASSNSNAYGGALYCSGAVSQSYFITNCTVANNAVIGGTAGSGGGIFDSNVNNPGNYIPTLINTIIANNTANTSGNNGSGLFADGGHNICADASFAFTVASLNNTDPRLGPLVYTGGSVPTLSLLANSPAIDAGDDSQAPATDARGAARVGSHSDIGAYERSVWQADASAAAPDGTTRLLWNRSDGLCNLWSVDANNNVVQSFDYGPYAGWTAVSVSVGSDNNTRLLWQHSSGAINVWSVDTAGGSGAVLASVHYGPYAGWTLNTLATGADNHTRLLWRNQDGTANVWNVDTRTGTDAATLLSSTHYGPFAGWTATGLAVGSDNHTRLLWTYQDGTANVWNVDTGTGTDHATLISTLHYGPYAGWTAANLSVGADTNTRLQWNNVDGTLNLWNLQIGAGVDHSVVLSSPMYGPYLDFACTGLSVGADNQARLLWNHTDGLLDLWRVNGSGNFLSSFHFGPF